MTDEVRNSARPPRRPETHAVRAGIATDLHHGAVVPPIHLSSTFAFDGFGKKRLYDYTRTGNPTRELPCQCARRAGGRRGRGRHQHRYVGRHAGATARASRAISYWRLTTAMAGRIGFYARSPPAGISMSRSWI